jgi:drug/metabolite transporter (DMT)-like permease
MSASPSPLFDRAAPLLFVLVWSTGWIVARYSADYADPLTFLCFRFGSAGALLLALSVAAGAAFPRTGRDWLHALISGVFLHAIYLGGVWWAIRQGCPPRSPR